jgi:hypothetical protein
MPLGTSYAAVLLLGMCSIWAVDKAVADVEAGDAYARDNHGKWTIGTSAVQVIFEVRDGKLLLSNFTNKLTQPAREYLGEKDAFEPLDAGAGTLNERFVVKPVWEKFFPARGTIDLGADKLQLLRILIPARRRPSPDASCWTTDWPCRSPASRTPR